MALWMYLVLSAWSCAAIIIPSVSFLSSPLWSHCQVSLLYGSLVCLSSWPCMGLFCQSSIRDFDVLSLYTFKSSSSLIKPSSHALLSHSSLFIFRYCPRDLFSALTHSSKLSRLFPPSLRGKYSLSTFDLGCSAWYMFSAFLVFLSILRSSEFFQSTMPALYLITGTAHVFMAFTVFPELSFTWTYMDLHGRFPGRGPNGLVAPVQQSQCHLHVGCVRWLSVLDSWISVLGFSKIYPVLTQNLQPSQHTPPTLASRSSCSLLGGGTNISSGWVVPWICKFFWNSPK